MLLSLHVHDRVIAGAFATYTDVERIRCNLIAICDEALGNVEQSEVLPAEQRRGFTFVLACHTPAASNLDKDAFQHELVLFDGHAFVWAWWLHLFHLLSVPAPSRSNNIALRQA